MGCLTHLKTSRPEISVCVLNVSLGITWILSGPDEDPVWGGFFKDEKGWPSELQETPVAIREQSGVLCFHSR